MADAREIPLVVQGDDHPLARLEDVADVGKGKESSIIIGLMQKYVPPCPACKAAGMSWRSLCAWI